MPSKAQLAAARVFVRSLNVLLKSARLYGVAHSRTAAQTRTAWDEFQTLLGSGEGAVTFGVSGSQLLLDGSPVEGGPAERSFAELLSAAGLSSLQFSPRVTPEDFQRFIAGFAASGGKPADLAAHLKQALSESGDATIRVNEVRFVAEDAALGEGAGATKLAAEALGLQSLSLQQLVSDPQRMLQLIAAAQGAQHGVGGGTGTGAGAGTGTGVGTGSGAAAGGGAGAGSGVSGGEGGAFFAAAGLPAPAPSGPLREGDVANLLRLVTNLAQATKSAEPPAIPVTEQVAALPANAQEMFRHGLAALASLAPSQKPDTPMLLQLAEHLAIRFALERFERGEVKVNAVRELLEKSSREMATLRKVLAVHEERMTRAGMEVESHADVLDRQFWATVPESGKRAVLLSAEAWCIPPRNVRQFVEHLLNTGDPATAGAILLNFTSCIGNEDAQVRRKVAKGLVDLAGLYGRCEGPLLASAVRCVAEQIRWETDEEIRELLSSTYVRLAQEAAGRRDYTTLHTAVRYLEGTGAEPATPASNLLPRIGFVDRLPEFIADALHAKDGVSPDLAALLARAPEATADQVAARFSISTRRDECQRLFEIFHAVGGAGVTHLTHLLRSAPENEAAVTVGLLSRFAPATAEELLPIRLPQWNRPCHDTVVRQLATAAAPERGRLLARIFPQLDKRVLPEAVDEIGMSHDANTTLLLRLARGESPQAADPLVRVKAIEAVGRLRLAAAAPYLRSLLEARRLLSWEHPSELRIVAAQAMSRIDPDWMRSFLSRSGLAPEQLALAPLDPSPDTPWARQRRYARVALQRAVEAVAETMRGECKLTATLLSLGGGMATSQFPLAFGSQVAVKLRTGLRRVEAQALVRDTIKEQVGFEIIGMDLEERSKLRRLLAGVQAHPA